MKYGSGYHHHKYQWFVNGEVISGAAGKGLVYNSETVFPKEPQKAQLSVSMEETYFRPPSKHFHLKNLHSTDYEIGGYNMGDMVNVKDKYPKKQHFVRGKIPGGSASNKMIYGTDELLHPAKLNAEDQKPSGFLYGTDAATKVGKPAHGPLPNNILWLEEKTEKDAAKHKKLASSRDDFLARHYEERQKKIQAEEEEKKRDLEELKSYNPWGRQGAGAPRLQAGPGEKPDTHMTTNVKALVEQPDQTFGGRPGGGAPNRSESGRVIAVYKADPELRFPRNAKRLNVETALRYGGQDEKYKKELESSIEEWKTRKQVQRQRSLEDELQHIKTDPFGRQGGGAPQKSSKGDVKTAFPTTLSKDIQELRQVSRRHPHAYNQVHQQTAGDPGSEYDPWGRGHGNPPEFNSAGRMVKPPQKSQENDLEGIGISVGRPGGGAPNVDRRGNVKVKKVQTLAKTTNGQTIQRDFSPKGDTYDPWGRGGAGAPIRGPDGEVVTRTAGRLIQDPDVTRTENSKDVATLLRDGKVGQLYYDPVTKEIVAQKKQTSDVTSQVFNIRRQKNEKSREYHTDLEAQAKERYELRQHSQQEQRVKSVEHLKTMDGMWGRPGAGAPLRKENADFARKQKLGLDPVDSSFTYRGT